MGSRSNPNSASSSRTDISEFQIAVLGSTAVGKSSLIKRYTKDTFSLDYTPNLLDNIPFRFRFGNRFGILSTLR